MDMPECCADCQALWADDDQVDCICMFADDYYDGSDSSEDRASFCPLRELPEKSDHPEHCDNGRFDAGWNGCLDAIEGGAHGKEQSE